VDVEQIMRDIRGRIAQRQGIDLSSQQIQDLAARRLESILDPRAIKPSLLDGLRRSAAAQTGAADRIPNEPAFSFEDTTIYDSHRGALRFARRMMNPLLKLLFNPNPVIRALHLQAKLNVEAAEREAERDRRQTEWNALHYEIVQRLVTEVSRVSLELQALSMRVEALGARVDFNDRRVGILEGSAHRARPQSRPPEPLAVNPNATSPVATGPVASSPVVENSSAPAEPMALSADAHTPDAARRRRRRRRGRRSGSGPGEYAPAGMHGAPALTSASGEAAVGVSSAADAARDDPREVAVPGASAEAGDTNRLESAPPPASETPAPQVPMAPPDTDRRED